jgi:hypothetical protein
MTALEQQPIISFTFNLKNEPIIVITEDGFEYKGELIKDSGEVYRLFKKYLEQHSYQEEISDEEIVNRLEIIDKQGRQYVQWDCSIELSYQDNGRTLKIFVNN